MSFKYKGELIAGSGEGSAEEVYSTEEVRIGTWIDGRPLIGLLGVLAPHHQLENGQKFMTQFQIF